MAETYKDDNQPQYGSKTSPSASAGSNGAAAHGSAATRNGAPQPAADAPRPEYSPHYGRPTRRPSQERENAFDALAWLLEGATGIVDELRHNDLGLSEDFWLHATAARRETLLAMQAALESIIEKTTAAENEQQARNAARERRGGIKIDF